VSENKLVLVGIAEFLNEATDGLSQTDVSGRASRNAVSRITGQTAPVQEHQILEQQQMGVVPNPRDGSLESNRRNVFYLLEEFAYTMVQHCYKELHEVLCTEGKLASALGFGGTDAKSVGTALAAALAASLGFTNPVAIGLAAIILLIVATSGVKAFCSLDKEGLSHAIKQISPPRTW
jgi:hypothetical protein